LWRWGIQQDPAPSSLFIKGGKIVSPTTSVTEACGLPDLKAEGFLKDWMFLIRI